MRTGDEEDCWEAWSTVLKGFLFPHAVVLCWERNIFHHVDLLQVLLPLPDVFGWREAAAPACPAGRTGTFSKQFSCWTQQAVLSIPVPALSQAGFPEGSALSAHQLYTRKLWSHLLLGGGNQISVLCSSILLLGVVCMEGGWGLGLVVHLTAPFLKRAAGHCWRAVALTPESERRRWQ